MKTNITKLAAVVLGGVLTGVVVKKLKERKEQNFEEICEEIDELFETRDDNDSYYR